MEHGELRRVAGGHIIPRIVPIGLSALSGVGEIVALGNDIAVVAGIVGDRRNAECLAARDEVVGEQVILKVRLVRGIAGLTLEGLDATVELGEGNGIVGADELLHIGRFARGLEGVVAVEVVAAGGMSGEVGATVDVLLGNEDKEHVLEQLVLDVHGLGLDGVILLEIDLAGQSVILGGQIAEVAGLVLDEVGDGDAALLAHGTHFLFQLGLALGGEAGEHIIGDRLFTHEQLGEGEHAVGRRDLVGVDVGVHHRHADVIELAAFELLEHGVGIGLGLLGELEPVVHARLGIGDDQIGHIAARGGLAHGELCDVEAVLGAGRGDLVELLVDLPHGVEVLVGRDLDRRGADGFSIDRRGQIIVAALIDIVAAVRVGNAVVDVGFARILVHRIEIVVDVEADVEHGLAVRLGDGELDVGELVRVRVLGHPLVQRTARVGVGEDHFVHIGAGAVTQERKLHLAGGHGALQRALADARDGNGQGNVFALHRGHQWDGRVHGKARAEEGIVRGIHCLHADRADGGDRQRKRQRQGHQQSERLADKRMSVLFHFASPFSPSLIGALRRGK